MRTIVEASRTMLHSMNMSKMFWAEAVNTAVFTLNRTGSSPKNIKSPYELWYSKKPDINLFKVFGSKVAVHIPKERRLKLDAKSRVGIIVGYSENTKGYRIYSPQKKKVEILKDIIVLQDENEIKKKKEISFLEEKETEENSHEERREMDETQENRRQETSDESEEDEQTGKKGVSRFDTARLDTANHINRCLG